MVLFFLLQLFSTAIIIAFMVGFKVLLETNIYHRSSFSHCVGGTQMSLSDYQNDTNETECRDLSNSFYIKIFWTSAAEVPGKSPTLLSTSTLPFMNGPHMFTQGKLF